MISPTVGPYQLQVTEIHTGSLASNVVANVVIQESMIMSYEVPQCGRTPAWPTWLTLTAKNFTSPSLPDQATPTMAVCQPGRLADCGCRVLRQQVTVRLCRQQTMAAAGVTAWLNAAARAIGRNPTSGCAGDNRWQLQPHEVPQRRALHASLAA